MRFKVTICFIALAAAAWLGLVPGFPGAAGAAGPKVLLRNEIPYGEREGALMAQGSKISGLLCVESRGQQDVRVELTVRAPHPLKASTDDRHFSISEAGDGVVLETAFSLRVEGEKWFSSVTLSIPPEAPPGEYEVRAVARVVSREGEETVEQATRLRVVSRADVPGLFRIGELLLPCNEKGEAEDRQEENTVLIKGRKTF